MITVPLCAFGNPSYGHPPVGDYHCIGCAQFSLKLTREFWADVKEGRYCRHGYTKSDLKAAEKKGRPNVCQ